MLVHGSQSISTIDGVATVDETGKQWAIALVNRHPSNEIACTVKIGDVLLDGKFEATILAGDSPDAYNDVAHPRRVVPVKTQLVFQKRVCSLPPHSLTIVKLTAR
jgi:alpha-N-arabinofuranosidase